MSPTIRIDDDVFEELKKHAEPFVDTPNTVLRRLLNLGETGPAEMNVAEDTSEVLAQPAPTGQRTVRQRRRKAARPPRAKKGSILHESAYELPMLQILSEHGGRAAAREVIDELETRLDGQLTELDNEQLASGDVRWRNRAQFVRLRLVEQGDMVKDSPRGTWELSDQGRHRLAVEAA
jgi:Mrr N-terminal domain